MENTIIYMAVYTGIRQAIRVAMRNDLKAIVSVFSVVHYINCTRRTYIGFSYQSLSSEYYDNGETYYKLIGNKIIIVFTLTSLFEFQS